MKFCSELTKEEYINFCNKSKNSHFLQSYEWGICSHKSRGQQPIYVGVKNDDNKVIGAALLLKKSTPFKMCYYYSPRGFVIDYSSSEILKTMTDGLKVLMKRNKCIYLRVDPGVMYQEIDEDAKKIDHGRNNYKLFNEFIELGYKHQGFPKLYEGNQPRYTFRIDLNRSVEEIESKFSKTFMKTVRRSYNYDLKIVESDDIKTFWDLNTKIANKNAFTLYPLDHYKHVYNEFKEQNHIKIFNALVFPDELLEKSENELAVLKLRVDNGEVGKKEKDDVNNVITRLEKDIDKFNPLRGMHKDGLVVCSLICTYTTHGAWTLYIGNDDLGTYTFAVNRCYYESIIEAQKNNYDFMDLFGTVGDPNTNFKNLAGLHDFKRKFGGEYIEFIGEFDLVNKPIWYGILPKLLWIYRKLK